MRRSRLIIPLFAAAAATYIALVREDGMIRRRRTTPLPAGPATADVPDPSRPVMQPPPMPSAPVYTPKPTTVVSPVVAPTPDAETVEPPSTGVETASVASSPEVDTPPEPIEAVTEPVPAPSLDVAPIAVPAPTPVDVFERHIAPSPPPDAADKTAPVEWTEMEGLPDLPAAAQGAAAAGAVAPEGPVLDEGTFSIGGWAAAPGHSVVSAVTYHHRLPASVDADRIVLHIESAENIPDDGLVVLSDPGFAPDREGFTLLLGAAAPGPFSAAGTYRAVG